MLRIAGLRRPLPRSSELAALSTAGRRAAAHHIARHLSGPLLRPPQAASANRGTDGGSVFRTGSAVGQLASGVAGVLNQNYVGVSR